MNCAQEMNRAYSFRKLSEKSDATLRAWLSALLPLPVDNNPYNTQQEVPKYDDMCPDSITNSDNISECC